ncbi:unnamed protein product [Strongylus vulgaris]|uniref:Uncharacterized protein n=1 Tax=Strongylus vulgaris TaxID=40348 RepID=A0A3P7LK26_STRVU|nr:unnamed protein product [Strongylus vulgaris]
MQMRIGSLIQNGIVEGQRFALSSDLWRYAKATVHCDLLITFKSNQEEAQMRDVVAWLVDLIKTHEPQLKIEVRHHNLKNCYALYLTANYKSLLKGAELCHIKKNVKSHFGGGLREFSFEEAQCFAGIEGRNTFLTDMERSFIGKFNLFTNKILGQISPYLNKKIC